MIIAYMDRGHLVAEEITEQNKSLLQQAVWVDLLAPSKHEEDLVEACLSLDIPTRDEMVRLELSNRLYKENDVLFMAASVVAQSNSLESRLEPVSFVLTPKQLITVRYIPISVIPLQTDVMMLLVELLEKNINRLADMSELIGKNLDEYSRAIFMSQTRKSKQPDYMSYMQRIGLHDDLTTKARESLLSFQRLTPYLLQTAADRLDKDCVVRLNTMQADINALNDHVHFMANKVTFLLDATLGMVYIQQNNIIKIFSIAAVIFLPPTLISSMYGMNFEDMPELSWHYGYPFALVLMLFAAWVPYQYFKSRKWL